MTNTPKNYWRVVAFAFIGLALVGAGLSLAALSNPKRFSLSVADDRNIQFFALAGFACTLAGIGLFLYAVRHTTKSMPAHAYKEMQTSAWDWDSFYSFPASSCPTYCDVPIEIGVALVLAVCLHSSGVR
jgi:hypothetical protein